MRLLVVYTSKTGFTKRYAQWLAEDLSGDCFPLEQAARVDFSGYDTVAFGSSVHAGGVRKVAWLKKRLPRFGGQAGGAVLHRRHAPEEKTVEQCVAQNLTPQERQQVKAFYLWGGLNYQAMGPVDKWMMGVFRKMLASQKNPSPEDKLAAQMVGSPTTRRTGPPSSPWRTT